MKILVDMNLSLEWIPALEEAGFEAIHWSTIGQSSASDEEILAWAKSYGYVVFTHDLDFGAILAATKAKCPSVFQVRTQNISPNHLRHLVFSVLNEFQDKLMEGALISVDREMSRVRILPIS
jgi:predicted nuclease of predicted toxin-antitoxin system